MYLLLVGHEVVPPADQRGVVMVPNVLKMLDAALHQMGSLISQLIGKDYINRSMTGSLGTTTCMYQSLDAADMADVIRASEGRQPPGKMYSLMKSELRLYSSYRSSGIEMNCTRAN